MQNRKIKILVTNDDGIDSPGIYALVLALKEIGEVFVIAPDSQKKCSITFNVNKQSAESNSSLSG